MLELGIDEATIVLMENPNYSYYRYADEVIKNHNQHTDNKWEKLAEKIITIFSYKADFINVFGSKEVENIAPAGYTIAYHYGIHNFYFSMAYHPEHREMGVIVKFSAQALDYYLENRHIKFYQFMHIITDDIYIARFSRIDLTADYIDENIDTTTIYENLSTKKIDIFDKFPGPTPDQPIYRRRGLKPRGFCDGIKIPTIYIGSPKSDAEMRIYDKRQEQIDRMGAKYKKALSTQNWTRFEMILRKKYAHQFTEALTQIYTDIAFANLIASVIVQRFRFMVVKDGLPDCETDYTQMLIDLIMDENFKLRAAVHTNYDLAKNIIYMYEGSGLLSTIYKVYHIWGKHAAWDLLAHTLDMLENYEPNEKCTSWLILNTNDYIKTYPTFREFLEINFPEIIEDSKQKKGLREVTYTEPAPKGKVLNDTKLATLAEDILKYKNQKKGG